MKHAIGIVRKSDPLGRIVIPVEYRHVLKMDISTTLTDASNNLADETFLKQVR